MNPKSRITIGAFDPTRGHRCRRIFQDGDLIGYATEEENGAITYQSRDSTTEKRIAPVNRMYGWEHFTAWHQLRIELRDAITLDTDKRDALGRAVLVDI